MSRKRNELRGKGDHGKRPPLGSYRNLGEHWIFLRKDWGFKFIVIYEAAFGILYYEGDFVEERGRWRWGSRFLHEHPLQERGASEDGHRSGCVWLFPQHHKHTSETSSTSFRCRERDND